ncbi:MAG TPA: MFS transporter, partial [Clostridia bacterium]|nr:MFS transporter [Clostridia bacterium]
IELINSPNRRNQDFFIIQVIFANAFAILTGGEFLSGFAIFLGASDELVGYIPLIGGISGISLIFFGILMERFTKRRKLVLTLNSIVKPLLISIILIPLLVPKPAQVLVLFILLFVVYILNAFLGLAVNSWFVKAIPIKLRGRYFSIRQIYAVLVMVLLPIVAGGILDTTRSRYLGFIILFAAAFVFGMGETYAFSKVEDAQVEGIGKGIKILDVFRIPIKNKEFMDYTVINVLFHIALYLSASYTQVYMIRYLELSYTFITSMTMLNAVLQMFAYSQWGKIGDRYGNVFVMYLSYGFYAMQMALWALVTKGSMYVFIPLVYGIGSFANSGFMVGSFNYRYDIMPEKGRSFYDAFYSAAIGITLLIAPWIGGRIKGFIAGIPYLNDNIMLGEFRIIFALSALGLAVLVLYIVLKRRKANTNQGISI